MKQEKRDNLYGGDTFAPPKPVEPPTPAAKPALARKPAANPAPKRATSKPRQALLKPTQANSTLKTETVRVNFDLDKALYEEFKTLCGDRPIARVIRAWIKAEVEKS